jgi:hypothetical protein
MWQLLSHTRKARLGISLVRRHLIGKPTTLRCRGIHHATREASRVGHLFVDWINKCEITMGQMSCLSRDRSCPHWLSHPSMPISFITCKHGIVGYFHTRSGLHCLRMTRSPCHWYTNTIVSSSRNRGSALRTIETPSTLRECISFC